jgi:cytochrome c-type biogenesis protein CcmH
VSRRLAALACTLTAISSLGGAEAANAAKPGVSLPVIEREVMCVSCGVPLNIAESMQADRERAFIQSLIDRGQTESQIKQALVGQFGPRVLATPGHHGFGLAAYLVPIALGGVLLAVLAMLLVRWRRRARAGPAPASPSGPTLDPTDAARLDADLARFDA